MFSNSISERMDQYLHQTGVMPAVHHTSMIQSEKQKLFCAVQQSMLSADDPSTTALLIFMFGLLNEDGWHCNIQVGCD